jgi:hypothetical protein
MEASCGCQRVGRHLAGFGHDVRPIPAQFVKPYVKSQKNDYRDADACRSGSEAKMRFVPIETEDQLDLQALHRVRERLLNQKDESGQPTPRLLAGARLDRTDGSCVSVEPVTHHPRGRREQLVGRGCSG